MGYLPNSPYDAVIITAAAESIPKNLISQISKKGRIVLPLIDNKNQKLVKLKNTKNGIINKTVEDVFFVPLLPGIEINE